MAVEGDSIKAEENQFQNPPDDEELMEKYKELQNLKKEINEQIKALEENGDERALKKMEKMKSRYNSHYKDNYEMTEENLDKGIKVLSKVSDEFSLYQKFMDAFETKVDIDPGRLMGLTDGIFGMVMTLLIFGMALPEFQISNYNGFINFAHSLAPSIGLTLVSFILLASFWICHHEFIRIKSLNMPYLWINMLFLASISFIPFTTSIVGNYSQFFLANVIFGLNIFITIALFLLMFQYAYDRGFLENEVSEDEKNTFEIPFT